LLSRWTSLTTLYISSTAVSDSGTRAALSICPSLSLTRLGTGSGGSRVGFLSWIARFCFPSFFSFSD
jgi:hypothetical protein